MSILFNPQDQDAAMESRPRPSEQWSPAPYGKACIGCARAKCKCFYHPNGTGCERCLRLGKHCEPSVAVRRRKARRQSPPQPTAAASGEPPQPQQQQQQQVSLESKLDEVVSLLKAQSTSVQSQPTASISSSQPLEHSNGTSPSNNSTLVNSASHDSPEESAYNFCHGPKGPNIMIDTDNSVFHLVRPDKLCTYPPLHDSPILKDVSTHVLSERQSGELLSIFRKDFLPFFPFVSIPKDTKAADLRIHKPFLWLVIMALATRNVAEQFAMEETMWKVISQRVVIQHHVSLDLLQGLLCFSSWSHYFKQDKPFMVTLVQLAVGMAYDADLNKDSSKLPRNRTKYLTEEIPVEKAMTLEQRRTFVAVFQLSSAAWSSYRKTEPIRLTPYIEECIKILNDGTESEMDRLLAFQARCHIINNQLTCPASGASDSQPLGAPSKMLQTAMLRQLEESRRALPKELQDTSSVLLYVYSTELTIRDQFLGTVKSSGPSSLGQFQRLEELELTLICIERWLETWKSIPLTGWVGINVDSFSQFTHCLAVLYRLTTLEDPDWDNEDVKRRADILDLLDYYAATLGEVHKATGMVDSPGPRSGMFFKTSFLMKAIKKLFAKALDPEYEEQEPPRPDQQPVDELMKQGNIAMAPDISMEEPSFTQEFLSGLAEEPWISEVFGTTWDFAMDLDVDWQQQQQYVQ